VGLLCHGNVIKHGVEHYQFVNTYTALSSVGLVALDSQYGYLGFADIKKMRYLLFEYETGIFTSGSERFRRLKVVPLGSVEMNIRNTPEQVKLEYLTKKYKPGTTWLARFTENFSFPFEETGFPIIKRRLIELLSKP